MRHFFGKPINRLGFFCSFFSDAILLGKLIGYSQRSLVGTGYLRKNRLFGDRFFSQHLTNQRVESRMRGRILKRMLHI